MRIISTALAAAAVGALAAGVTATVATAQDNGNNDSNITSFGFSVTPKTVKPGGKVDLTVTECDKEATASSAVFDKTTLGMGGGTQSAQVKVDWDAKPGAEYDVTFSCGGESGTAPLKIAAVGGGDGGSEVGATSRPRPQPDEAAARPAEPGRAGKEAVRPARPAAPAQPVKPTRPARGGLGGSQDGNTAMLAGGAGLTAAGAFGGVLLLRRREAPGRG